MIVETVSFLVRNFPSCGIIGLLASIGTHTVVIYGKYLSPYNQFTLLEPDKDGRQAVHSSIYDGTYGIKAVSPVSRQAKETVRKRQKSSLILAHRH